MRYQILSERWQFLYEYIQGMKKKKPHPFPPPHTRSPDLRLIRAAIFGVPKSKEKAGERKEKKKKRKRNHVHVPSAAKTKKATVIRVCMHECLLRTTFDPEFNG